MTTAPVTPPSLATGDVLNAETWADFEQRLRHDCVGQGVRSHGTAAALFTVQAKKIDYGFEVDYAEGRVVRLEDRTWFSPKAYWSELDRNEKACLNRKAQDFCDCKFMHANEEDQWELLAELEDHTVTGWNTRWEIVNSHFTKDAAEAFIRRKKHDYGEMRVRVESQYFAWEFEAIKTAILDGTLTYSPKLQK
ncbi:hypothetical protein [Pseudomonas psychrophila]|uniref:Uncharacterized protein n=1 Tax=Pseudomonas psychrophila TaxID=122355 RepID=A0A8I1FX70_9PSED|nr:hypothetical protein [Pseudomonas psychrophila]AVX93288.1 hypothetical protein PkP19E3_34745 [Pseudomonas koreensis]MBJ2259728.1 hypothetical protein [Pseudomonas psychrophila]